MECNASGYTVNTERISSMTKDLNAKHGIRQKSNVYTMIDIAKASSTSPINLSRMDVDFVSLSFYKIFGLPTGLGALIVKRSSAKLLTLDSNLQSDTLYFGGGSVDAILPDEKYLVPRKGLSRFVSGTPHYRGIANLTFGFKVIQELGGMETISKHTKCLAYEFVRRLKLLQHRGGGSVIIFYGEWNETNCQFQRLKNGFKS